MQKAMSFNDVYEYMSKDKAIKVSRNTNLTEKSGTS